MSPVLENNWQPSASWSVLKQRAQYLAKIREFFFNKNIIEVETPLLSRYATTDPQIESIATELGYLHTSPEFFMKRLLVAEADSIYQMGKVFRKEEISPLHNPEFTLLEWYRLDFSLKALMQEVFELISFLNIGPKTVQYYTYQAIFEKYLKINPITISIDQIKAFITKNNYLVSDLGTNKDIWLDYLLSHYIFPQLPNTEYTFIYHYPASQASLAKLYNPTIAERFELFLGKIELANGFVELNDAKEQRLRFEEDLCIRAQNGQKIYPMDEYFLQALEQGLPDCAGVALGVDRLLMLGLELSSISEIMAFYDI